MQCVNTLGSFQCVDVHECNINPCPKGTRCTNTFGSYTCDDIDECGTNAHNCHRRAECQNTSGSYICKCRVGYQGTSTSIRPLSQNFHSISLGNGKGRYGCRDIDECQKDVCEVGSRCVNTRGSYRCNDIDECAGGTHKCDQNAQCENVNDGYTCTCNHGYRGKLEV